jgi:uncharacterized protein YjaG (DUF416 family)
MPAYRRFATKDGRDCPDALEYALEEVWANPGQVRDREEFEQRIETLMALVPQEEGFRGPWTQEVTNAQNAGMSAVYALRAKLTGAAQEAAWAARVAYEALDNFVINSENIDTNKPGEERRIIAHPLVQAELARQHRDLEELDAGKQEVTSLIARLRDRARAEAAIFYGLGP